MLTNKSYFFRSFHFVCLFFCFILFLCLSNTPFVYLSVCLCLYIRKNGRECVNARERERERERERVSVWERERERERESECVRERECWHLFAICIFMFWYSDWVHVWRKKIGVKPLWINRQDFHSHFWLFLNETLYIAEVFRSREGVNIDHDVIMSFPLGRFY